jgi:hypothetical protein
MGPYIVLLTTWFDKASKMGPPAPGYPKMDDFWKIIDNEELKNYYTLKMKMLPTHVDFTYDTREFFTAMEGSMQGFPDSDSPTESDGEGTDGRGGRPAAFIGVDRNMAPPVRRTASISSGTRAASVEVPDNYRSNVDRETPPLNVLVPRPPLVLPTGAPPQRASGQQRLL